MCFVRCDEKKDFMDKKEILLGDVVSIIYADNKNSEFFLENGFLALRITLPYNGEEVADVEEKIISEEKTEERMKEIDENSSIKHHPVSKTAPTMEISSDKTTVTYTYKRVFLHRTFPYENPFEYISVLNANNEEVCMIKKVDEIKGKELIISELDQMYYEPEILKILELKEQMGFTYIKAVTDGGLRTMTVRDIFRSITHISSKYIYITDIYGNRYTIKDLEHFDKKSYKKIELFL